MRKSSPSSAWMASVVVVLAAIVVALCRGPVDVAGDAATRDSPPAALRGDASSEGNTSETVARSSTPAVAPDASPRKFERRFMFDCAGEQFFVRIGDDEVRLLPPGSLTGYYIPLARVGSLWRGRYANDDIVFRLDGDVAAFELGEHGFENCAGTRDRAALAEVNGGVFVQAFGHDPPWTFEITQHELTLTTERGARQVQVPAREPIDSGAKITFRSVLGTQEMVAVVDRIPCLDAPTGETFANTVSVTFDGDWYYGCGRFIRYRDEPTASR